MVSLEHFGILDGDFYGFYTGVFDGKLTNWARKRWKDVSTITYTSHV
jgi:hypothetical protein